MSLLTDTDCQSNILAHRKTICTKLLHQLSIDISIYTIVVCGPSDWLYGTRWANKTKLYSTAADYSVPHKGAVYMVLTLNHWRTRNMRGWCSL